MLKRFYRGTNFLLIGPPVAALAFLILGVLINVIIFGGNLPLKYLDAFFILTGAVVISSFLSVIFQRAVPKSGGLTFQETLAIIVGVLWVFVFTMLELNFLCRFFS
jgi:hypothetical protein